jgi:hypothetical protein
MFLAFLHHQTTIHVRIGVVLHKTTKLQQAASVVVFAHDLGQTVTQPSSVDTMSTFHPFARLPYELRAQIWEMTVEPRVVDVRIMQLEQEPYRRLVSPTPVPATLQSCKEARDHGLYKRTFSELDGPSQNERRYVWLNLGIDLVNTGTCPFWHFRAVAAQIKRLKFEREYLAKSFFPRECKELRTFLNAEEIHVVCMDGLWNWRGAVHDIQWPCTNKNLVLIDPDDGRVVKGCDFEGTRQEVYEKWRTAVGNPSDFSDDDIEFLD